MNKIKIILLSLMAIVTILAFGIKEFVPKNEEELNYHRELKTYKESTESKEYISLEILDAIDTSTFTKNILYLKGDSLKDLKKDDASIDIINIIKDYDPTFNEDDYKISYNADTIFIKYYINNLIETNKVYLVQLENDKATKITLGGVKKKKLDNIKEVNNKELMELISSFKGDKKKSAILKKGEYIFKSKDILNDDNTIKKENLVASQIDCQEKYYFDYNSKELFYHLETTARFGEGEVIEVKLN